MDRARAQFRRTLNPISIGPGPARADGARWDGFNGNHRIVERERSIGSPWDTRRVARFLSLFYEKENQEGPSSRYRAVLTNTECTSTTATKNARGKVQGRRCNDPHIGPDDTAPATRPRAAPRGGTRLPPVERREPSRSDPALLVLSSPGRFTINKTAERLALTAREVALR